MRPKDLATSIYLNTKDASRIAVNKNLLQSAETALVERLKSAGNPAGHISNAKLVEIALINLLTNDDGRAVLVNLPDTPLYNAVRNTAFGSNLLTNAQVYEKIDPIYEFTRNLDMSRRKDERMTTALLYSQTLLLRLLVGDPTFQYDQKLADSNFNTVISEMASKETEAWVKDVQMQAINAINRNKINAAK